MDMLEKKLIASELRNRKLESIVKNLSAVTLGRLGGAAGRGKSKARTSEQARAAVNARWAKRKKPKA